MAHSDLCRFLVEARLRISWVVQCSRIDSVAQPAFYRPEEGNQSAVVQARIVSQIEMDSVRMALALEANTANTDVGLAFEWNDYEEASLYLSPGSRGYHSRGRRGGTGFSGYRILLAH